MIAEAPVLSMASPRAGATLRHGGEPCIIATHMGVRRFFLVGCPRSGTTLLQACVAAHPDVASFPETHFFNKAHPRNPLRRALGWPSLRAWRYMAGWTRLVGRPDLAPLDDVRPWTRDYARGFRALLDRWAADEGRSCWLEKTPEHVYRIPEIARAVPGARFIHLVRNGEDVVASLHPLSNRNPRIWRGRMRHLRGRGLTLEDCVARWNASVSITASHRGDAAHHIVRYERLVEDPPRVLRELCDFMGLPFSDAMLRRDEAARRVTLPFEEWKKGAGQPIVRPPSRFAEVFSAEQQAFVKTRLRAIDF